MRPFLNNRVHLYSGDCRDVLPNMAPDSIDAIVTDPPYHLTTAKRFAKDNINGKGIIATKVRNRADPYARTAHGFMGQAWDGGDVAFDPETWKHVYRVMKPGAHLIAFGGTRTYHRLATAIEDAGFEIRDAVMWHYGQGFPKSINIAKQIDKSKSKRSKVIGIRYTVKRIQPGATVIKNGAWGKQDIPYHATIIEPVTPEGRKWNGYGTALKPATEILCLARKPLSEKTVVANVLKHGTGALNIDGCRIGTTKRVPSSLSTTPNKVYGKGLGGYRQTGKEGGHNPNVGRWPANVCHDGSDEVVSLFPNLKSGTAIQRNGGGQRIGGKVVYSGSKGLIRPDIGYSDDGSAARFFYCAKANEKDRAGSKHPTVKPLALLQWLIRLVTPENGIVLDPFAGTGTTAQAAVMENCFCVLVEQSAEYRADIIKRMGKVSENDLRRDLRRADKGRQRRPKP